MEAIQNRLFIGKFFVDAGLLTEDQVQVILHDQKGSGADLTFGEIAVRLNFITNRQRLAIGQQFEVQSALSRFHREAIWIPENMMLKALTDLVEDPSFAGRGVSGTHYFTDEEWMEALQDQQKKFGKPPIIYMINKRILERIEEKTIGKSSFPVNNEAAPSTVITVGPVNLRAVGDVRETMGSQPQHVAAEEEVRGLCRAIYTKRRSQHQEEISEATSKHIVVGDTGMAGIEEDRTVVDGFNSLLLIGARRGATDLHMEPMDHKLRIRYRIDGTLRHFCDLPIEMHPRIVSRIKVLCGLDITDKRHHQDGKIRATILGEEIDLRISTYASILGEKTVIRYLPKVSENRVDQVGLAPRSLDKYLDIVESPSGVILITGPTGCGKTTTLYASIKHLNTLARNIITVEDPVEYTLPGVAQCAVNPKIGVDYLGSLKAILRQDPDVVILGEIRDSESAEAAVQAGLTGHLVFSTFHTDDSTSALLRLMDMGIETFLISSTVVSVVSQRLIRLICPFCREPYTPPAPLFDVFQIRDFNPREFDFYHGVGCEECNFTGFRGRVGIFEILKLNDPVRDAILKRRTSMEIRDIARRTVDLVSMREDGLYKAIKGLTTPEEILRSVYHSETDLKTARTIDQVFQCLEGAPPPRSVKKTVFPS